MVQYAGTMKTLIPPPFYAIACAAMMWLLDRLLPAGDWLTTPWTMAGPVLMAIALLPAVAALLHLRHHRTTIDPRHPENSRRLVTSGIYAYSRNPMYLSLLLALIGWAITLGNLTALAFPPLFAAIVTQLQIVPEERILARRFSTAFDDYHQRVRRWL